MGPSQRNRGQQSSQGSIISKHTYLDSGNHLGCGEQSLLHFRKEYIGVGFHESSRVQGSGDNDKWILWNEESLRYDLQNDHPGDKERTRMLYSLTLVLLEEIQSCFPPTISSLSVLTHYKVSPSICNLETGVDISCLFPPLDHTLCLSCLLVYLGLVQSGHVANGSLYVVSPSCLALSHTREDPVLW